MPRASRRPKLIDGKMPISPSQVQDTNGVKIYGIRIGLDVSSAVSGGASIGLISLSVASILNISHLFRKPTVGLEEKSLRQGLKRQL